MNNIKVIMMFIYIIINVEFHYLDVNNYML